MSNWTIKPPLGAQLNHGHPLSAGIVGAWLLNEGAGKLGRAMDLSGYGNHGTFMSDAHSSPGKFGSAVDLVGNGSDDYIDVPSAFIDILEASNAFTIVSWAKLSAVAADGSIAGQYYGADVAKQFMLYWDVGGSGCYVGIVNTTGGVLSTTVSSTTTAAVGEWHQVVMTWDGSFGTLNLYQDGTFMETTGSSARTMASSGEPMGIGSESTARREFAGQIDHVIIYNRALSANAVASLYMDPFQMFQRQPIELWAGATSAGNAIPIFSHHYTKNIGAA